MDDGRRDFRFWRRGADADTDDPDLLAVRAVMERSRDMFLERSETGLSRLMHPEALVVGRLAGRVLTGGPSMIAEILAGPSPAGVERTWNLEHMSVGAGLANVTVRATEGGGVFLAHVTLVLGETGWRIVTLAYEAF